MPGPHTFYDGATMLQPIATYFEVQVDRINFVICMFSSLPLACVFKRFCAPGVVTRQTRTIFPLLIGIVFCFFCFGRASKHLLANALLNYAIMRWSPPKLVHKLVFGFSMGYLLFIHFFRWLVLTRYYLDITGPMMVAVQKITTLAFSLHDGKVKKKEELSEVQKREAITEVPSLVEYMSYVFNFQTALTGPVNFFSDYVAFLSGVHVTPGKDGKEPSALGAAVRKLAESFVYLMIIATFGARYPPEIIAEKEYLALPYMQWFMWWFLVIFLIRVNYYFAWIFADAVCNLSGFGFSGYDDRGNAKWELCTNVRPYQVECSFPSYLQNMTHHRSCLFYAAKASQDIRDWNRFHSYSRKFDYLLKKYNDHREKVLNGKNKKGFYKPLNRKLGSVNKIPCLKYDGNVAVSDEDKVNLLADKFFQVFSNSDDSLSVLTPVVVGLWLISLGQMVRKLLSSLTRWRPCVPMPGHMFLARWGIYII
ncbi:hypothetical protein V3C99_018559 [Haemonchus contortus]